MLIKALVEPSAGGSCWTGVYASVDQSADWEKISKSYVSRILRLGRLAPDMVEAFLGGLTGSEFQRADPPLDRGGMGRCGIGREDRGANQQPGAGGGALEHGALPGALVSNAGIVRLAGRLVMPAV